MGSQLSQNEQNGETKEPNVITIDRSDIPDAYKRVYVTDDVVRNVLEHLPRTNLESKTEINKQIPPNIDSHLCFEEELSSISKEKKNFKILKKDYQDDLNKIFSETVEKVEKQLANTYESACKENEDEILKCLNENSNQLLKCDSLWKSYETCVSKFSQKILNEKTNTSFLKNAQNT